MVKFFAKQFAATRHEYNTGDAGVFGGVCRLVQWTSSGVEVLIETPTQAPLALIQHDGTILAVHPCDPSRPQGPWAAIRRFDAATERMLGIRGAPAAEVTTAAAELYNAVLTAWFQPPGVRLRKVARAMPPKRMAA